MERPRRDLWTDLSLDRIEDDTYRIEHNIRVLGWLMAFSVGTQLATIVVALAWIGGWLT